MVHDGRALRLANEAPRGDFDALVRAHADSVWRCLRAVGVPPSAIEDAAQDVFVVAFRQWDSYEERGSARAWLFAIGRRVAAGYRRRIAREIDEPIALVVEAEDTEDALALREVRRMVDAFLLELSEERRLVFFLSEVEGWSAPEVAEALELNLNTVYSRLRRAREQFEAYLRRTGVKP